MAEKENVGKLRSKEKGLSFILFHPLISYSVIHCSILEMLRSSALESDLADELLLLEFEKDSTNPNPSRRRLSAAHFLQEILDSDIDDFVGEGANEGEEEELEWLADKNAFPPLETSFAAPAAEISGGRRSPVYVLASALPYRAPAKLRSKGLRRRRRKALPSFISVPAKGRRKCRHCESEQTPQWRTGPDGPKTLCNACGVRFKSGRLVPEYRPANSPTFSAAVHSNSHRRIVEMRRQKYGGGGGGGGGARRSFVHGLAVM